MTTKKELTVQTMTDNGNKYWRLNDNQWWKPWNQPHLDYLATKFKLVYQEKSY